MADTQSRYVRNLSGKVVERELRRQLHAVRAARDSSLAIDAHPGFLRIGRATRFAGCGDGIKLALAGFA